MVTGTLNAYFHPLTIGQVMFDLIDEFGDRLRLLCLYGDTLRSRGERIQAFAVVDGAPREVRSLASPGSFMPNGSELLILSPEQKGELQGQVERVASVVYEDKPDRFEEIFGTDAADRLVSYY